MLIPPCLLKHAPQAAADGTSLTSLEESMTGQPNSVRAGRILAEAMQAFGQEAMENEFMHPKYLSKFSLGWRRCCGGSGPAWAMRQDR